MKVTLKLLAPVSFFIAILIARAQPTASRAPKTSSDGVWDAAEQTPRERANRQPRLRPGAYKVFKLNHGALRRIVAQAPKEFSDEARRVHTELTLPMPDGSFARFRVVESPIMEAELAAKFPEIRTYCGQGIDEPAATIRCSLTPRGFHAQVLSPGGAVQIEPADDASETHLSFYQRDLFPSSERWECAAPGAEGELATAAVLSQPATPEGGIALAAMPPSTVMLRTYRLAVAAMGEYTTYHGGTLEGAMAAIVSTINEVNGIFERDLAIRLVLVANNHLIVYTNAQTDPYTVPTDDTSRNTALDVNQTTLDAVIGSANYDLGYLFGVGGNGGNNLFSTVCVNGSKARGAMSATAMPEGWRFVLFTAHEIGHLFGASHSFNGLCPNRAGGAAFEPGTGSTLMCYTYAGGCGSADNLQPVSDSYFHSGNLDEVNAFVTNGSGRTCVSAFPTGNHAPVVSAGPNFTIPRGTPFTLAATGSDEDGDPLTFCWEERDLGPAQPAAGPGSADNGSSPLFRSFLPTNNPARTFPKLSDILNNRTTIGEQLPATSRTMRFRVTARDHRAGGGGVSGANMQVTVTPNAGPFVVTSPNTNVIWSGTQTVTWNVAGTTNAPISLAAINILLSTNGGLDFPITLIANTPNDGAAVVTLPNVYAPQARIKVEAAGNIFFGISNPDFTIVPAAPVLVKVGAILLAEECQPTNGVIDPDETVTIQAVFQNIGAADATGLAVTLLSGSGVLSPSPAQTNAIVRTGGEFVTNAFTFTASADLPCGGTIAPTFQLHVGSSDAGTAAFSFPIGKTELATTRLANTNVIVITSAYPANPASPYPAQIMVTNLPGAVRMVTATLNNLTYFYTYDLDVLLVGPGGQTALLMSDPAYGPANNVTLTFDDAAPVSLHEITQAVSGVYRPTDGEYLPDIFPLPAPPGPYGASLSVFDGTNPNGTWKLFVMEDYPQAGASGSIAGGWSLSITTSNTTCCHPTGLVLSAADAPDPVTVGSNLTYALLVTNTGAASVTDVVLSNALPARVSFVSATSSQGFCTNVGGVVACALGTLAGHSSAAIIIVATPNAAGVITNIASVNLAGASASPIANTTTILTTVVLPPVAIFINDISVREGDAGLTDATFMLSLSAPSGQPVSVRMITANGSATLGVDYVPTNIVVTIPPGSASQPVTIKIIGDRLIESNETFFVNLSSPTNATIADNQGKCTILDDDFIVAAVQLAGGDVRLRFTTQTNQTYRVERTDSLATPILWEAVFGSTNVLGTGAMVEVNDTAAGDRPQRFYRVRLN